ncbi:MAG: DUF2061 domain-containing protein [Albidovulum sp.]
MESGKRTIIKAILWNVLGLAVMMLVGFAASGSWSLGGKIAVANAVLGLISYVLYERLWARISWGRNVA